MAKQPGMWSRYLRVVFSHGFGIWTGTIVTVAVWLVDHAVDGELLGKAEWWVHPSLAVYVIVVALGLMLAQYRAWREAEHGRQALEEERDKLKGRLEHVEDELDVLQNKAISHLASAVRNPSPAAKRHSMTEALFRNIERTTPKLEVSALVEDLEDDGRHGGGLVRRRFVVLHARNEGTRSRMAISARCQVEGADIRCVWSLESGNRFVPGGRHAADINAGDSRLLMVAQVALNEAAPQWLALAPVGPAPGFVARLESPTEGIRYAARTTGDVLNLSGNELTISLKAEELHEAFVLRLLGVDEHGSPQVFLRRTHP
jgi:hypothetical protein